MEVLKQHTDVPIDNEIHSAAAEDEYYTVGKKQQQSEL